MHRENLRMNRQNRRGRRMFGPVAYDSCRKSALFFPMSRRAVNEPLLHLPSAGWEPRA